MSKPSGGNRFWLALGLGCFVLTSACAGGGGGGGGSGTNGPPTAGPGPAPTPGVNQAPIVDAGPDQSILVSGTVSLQGTVTDDGLPNPPGLVTPTWSKVSGPGSVTFADALAVQTIASFSLTGSYVLRLTANDGALSSVDETIVTVTSSPVAPTITSQPVNQTVIVGQNATFSVVANGTAPLSYQWRRNGTNIAGATGSSYTTPATTLSDNGATFRVVVSNSVGNVTSSQVTLSVVNQSSLPPEVSIPDFAASPTIASAASGNWSAAATWNAGRVPTGTDVVAISAGTTVTYDVETTTGATARVVGVRNGGLLRFSTGASTRLVVTTLLVSEGGALEVGTASSPVPANLTAQIVFTNTPVNTSGDPEQYGNGLLALGRVTIHGAVKSPTFVRAATEPRAGNTTLTLAQPVGGWRVGDRLCIPDTRHLIDGERWASFVPQWELATITAISSDNRTLTLQAGLQFNHLGATNAAGTLEYLPHVGNMTRNVTIRSESATGTRGHTLFTHRANVDIRYAAFAGLGRTTDAATGPSNIEGRYAVHFLNLTGPQTTPANGYQYTFQGNAVTCPLNPMPFRWGVVLDNSHYGLIRENVIYNWNGACLATVDGNSSFNVIERNFAMAAFGDDNPRDNTGLDGSVFWFHGFNNYVRDNVAANGVCGHQGIVAGSGFNFYSPPAFPQNERVPRFPGADVRAAGEHTLVDMQITPVREFARNEIYGGSATGVTFWHLGTDGFQSRATQTTVLRDTVVWHVWEEGFFAYPVQNVTLDGFVVRGHPRALNAVSGGTGLSTGDYWAGNITVRRADIQGMFTGTAGNQNTPGVFRIEDSYFRVAEAAISVQTLATPGARSDKPPRRTDIVNTRFDAYPGWPLLSISMDYETRHFDTNLIQLDAVYVYGYQGVPGANFRVYYREQSPSFIVPQSDPANELVGSPVAGLTNQQNWATYGIAIAGAVSPSLDDTTHPEIEGYTHPIP